MERRINNSFYDELGEDWLYATNHPIALLRAENALRIPWIIREIKQRLPSNVSALDIGCGAGFLTHALSCEDYDVAGIDLSEKSLEVAKKHDPTGRVRYFHADAYSLPFPDRSFDVVFAMDILEHVEEPERLIREASRVLKPNGLFFFHTFNRNFLSYLLIIKGVDWFVQNAPKNMHVYPLFIKPSELDSLCQDSGLGIQKLHGFRPNFSLPFFQMLITRKVPPNFSFRFTKDLSTGYCGFALKSKFH